jgi:hypothetical protein
MDDLKCFISCRFDQKDKETVDYIRGLLDALSFSTYVANDADIRPPEEKIRTEIEASDCICVIATRGSKVEGKESWFTSEWIYSEIGMAAALRKPIICFLEKGVLSEGLGEKKTSFYEFDRDSLKDRVFDAVRFISKTRKQIEVMKTLSPSTNYPFKVNTLYVHLSLKNGMYWEVEREYELESLKDELSELTGETWISNGVDHPFINPEFDAFNLDSSDRRKVVTRGLSKEKSRIKWRLGLEPALNKGDRLLLGWFLKTEGFIPVSAQQVNEESDFDVLHDPRYVEEGVTINNPTDRLVFEVSFPSGYEVDSADLLVVRGADPSVQTVPEEVRRIADNGGYSFKARGIRRSIRLEVDNPMPLHTYSLLWIPPYSDQ